MIDERDGLNYLIHEFLRRILPEWFHLVSFMGNFHSWEMVRS